jgi:chromosome segregation ATPase
MIDTLDTELEKLKTLRFDLEDLKDRLRQKEKEFKRSNIRLIQSIKDKENEIPLSEQRIRSLALSIQDEVKFYFELDPILPSLVERLQYRSRKLGRELKPYASYVLAYFRF